MANKEVVKKRSEFEHDQHRWMVLVGNGNNKVLALYRGCDTHLVSGHSVFQRSLKLPMDQREDRLEEGLLRRFPHEGECADGFPCQGELETSSGDGTYTAGSGLLGDSKAGMRQAMQPIHPPGEPSEGEATQKC